MKASVGVTVTSPSQQRKSAASDKNRSPVNFVIAGAARSATTAIARSLSTHPDVFLSDPKEVHFFANAGCPRHFKGPGDGEMINRSLVSDPTEFQNLFRGATQRRIGEGSVSTLFHADRSIAALKDYATPDVKVIVYLREPAARSHSSYLYLRGRGYEDLPSFGQGLDAEPERSRAGFHHMWMYRGMSRYDLQLPQFVSHFGDRLHIGIFEEFLADPESEMRTICAFLDIDEDVPFALDTRVNHGGEPKSRAGAAALRCLRRLRPIRDLVVRTTSPAFRERVRDLNLRTPTANDPILADLRVEAVPAIEAVEVALGRSVPSWHQ